MAVLLKVDIRGGKRLGYEEKVNSGTILLYDNEHRYEEHYTKHIREIKVEDENEAVVWLMVDKDNLTELIDALMVLRAGME